MNVWMVLLLMAGPGLAQVMPSLKMLNTARLFGCRLIGKDNGIDTEFAKAMLGMSNPAVAQRCLLGCMVGWMHHSTNFVLWETGHDVVPKLPGWLMSQVQDVVSDCVGTALSEEKKCSIVPAVANCVLQTERKNVVTWFQKKFMPWLPCWDYLKSKIPFVGFIDKTANNMRDSFMKQLVGAIRGGASAKNPQSSILDKPAPALGLTAEPAPALGLTAEPATAPPPPKPDTKEPKEPKQTPPAA